MTRSVVFLLLAMVSAVHAQGAPRPIHEWHLTAEGIQDGVVIDTKGRGHAKINGTVTIAREPVGGLVLKGGTSAVVSDDHTTIDLPKKSFTIDAWVRVDKPAAWGGIISCIEDNGGTESGFLLGIRNDKFTFALATTGANDGDGVITYLSSSRPFTPGKWHHVAATFDGAKQCIWVDGELQGTSKAQKGGVLYPTRTWVELGAYHDSNEHYRLHGCLNMVRIHKGAFSAKGIARLRNELKKGFPTTVQVKENAVTSEELAGPIEHGVQWLLKHQQPDGSWLGPQNHLYRSFTALATYTLIKCGLSPDHPAVRAGVSWVRNQKYHRTYDLGTVTMLLGAVPDIPKDEIALLADEIVDICGNGSRARPPFWGYPFGHTGETNIMWWDLSNTQYAVLGLRAAHKAGVKAGSHQFWLRFARHMMEEQGPYGGFGYHGRSGARNASMTTAGTSCMLIAQDILEHSYSDTSLSKALTAHINRGIMWIENHYSVTSVRAAGGGTAGWYYYYMYGLERVGSLSGKDRISGRDWHSEGSRELIRRQKLRTNGSWGDSDSNTCFALLFLRRGSRVSVPPRTRVSEKIGEGQNFVIGGNDQHPLYASPRRLSQLLRDRIRDGGGQLSLKWELDGKIVSKHDDISTDNLFRRGSFLEQALHRNGKHSLRGLLEVPASEIRGQFVRIELPGKAKILSLAEVEILSGGKNQARSGKTSQSSTAHSGPPQLAVDGNRSGLFEEGSITHTATEDNPWWEVDLGKVHPIERIAIANRIDGVQHLRLNGARLLVLDAKRRTVWSKELGNARKEVVEMTPGGGKGREIITSNTLQFDVDNVEEARHRAAMRDNRKNLIPDSRIIAASSSTAGKGGIFGAYGAMQAVDGRHATMWWTANGDRNPWISLKLNRPQIASAMKLTAARLYVGGQHDRARAKDVEVSINGRKSFRVRLGDTLRQKQTIRFSKTTVRTIRISIRSNYPGTRQQILGLKEIELFKELSADELEGKLPVGREVVTLIPRAGRTAKNWRYTTETPVGNWFDIRFGDKGWRNGKAFFGPRRRGPIKAVWSGGKLWLRNSFRLKRDFKGDVVIDVRCAGPVKVWINGVHALTTRGPTGKRYQSFVPTKEALKSLTAGKNSIAVEAQAQKAPEFDMGLMFRPLVK